MKVKFMSPGFSKEMCLLTDQGYIRFENAVGNARIVKPDGSSSRGRVWESGKKLVYSVVLEDGRKIRSTSDHVYKTNDGDECPAIALKGKRLLPFTECLCAIDLKYVQFGFLQKVGNLSTLLEKNWINLTVESGDPTFRKLFYVKKLASGPQRVRLSGYNKKLIEVGFLDSTYDREELPAGFSNKWSLIQKRSFLRGYASGCYWFYNDPQIDLSTYSRTLAEQISQCLEMDFGIHSSIEKGDLFTDILEGEVRAISGCNVVIQDHKDCHKFMEQMGTEAGIHIQRMSEILLKLSPRVEEISEAKMEMVYDFFEPEENWGVVEGFVVHN